MVVDNVAVAVPPAADAVLHPSAALGCPGGGLCGPGYARGLHWLDPLHRGSLHPRLAEAVSN